MAVPLFAEPTFPGPFLPPNCCFMLRGFYLHFSWNLCRIPFRVRPINIGSIVQTDSANLGESENKPSASFSPNKMTISKNILSNICYEMFIVKGAEQIFTCFHLNFGVSLIFRLVQGPISRIKCLYMHSIKDWNKPNISGGSFGCLI